VFPQTGQYSLEFDGTSGFVETTNQDQFGIFSWVCWFKRARVGGSGNADRLWMSVNNGGFGIGFQDDGSADKDKIFFSQIGVSGFLSVASITDTTTWHHVALTFNESTTTSKLYIDGVLDTNNTGYGPTFSSAGGNYTLGSRGAAEYFKGQIAQHAIFPFVLSPQQILDLYQGKYDPTSITPGMSWQFPEGSGSTTVDGTGNGNTGTLNGGVTWSTDTPAALRLLATIAMPEVTGGPIPVAPWQQHLPHQFDWLYVNANAPPPEPPASAHLAYPLEVHKGPPMPGAPWFQMPGTVFEQGGPFSLGPNPSPPSPSPVPGGGGVPVPGGTTQRMPVPRYNATGVDTLRTRDDRLQRFSEIVSQILNSLIAQGLIFQTGKTTWTLAGGAGGVLSFDGRAGAVTLSAADVASAYSGILANQFLAGTPLQARFIVAADLPFSGVAAGGYTLPNLIVDQWGRITAIANATPGADYEVPLTFTTGLTRTVNTVTVNTSQNIAILSNLTTNGFVKTSGGTGTLSIDTTTYLSAIAIGTPVGSSTNNSILYIAAGALAQDNTNFFYNGTTFTVNKDVYSNTNSSTGFIVEQSGTFANLFRINTATGRVGFGVAPTNFLHATGFTAASSAGLAGIAADDIVLITGTGGANTRTTSSSGGIGGNFARASGAGGQQTGATSGTATGGRGGNFTDTLGAGGAQAQGSAVNNTGGAGGAYTMTMGVGGTATGATSATNLGGAGGALRFVVGVGGNASGSTGTNRGGAGGVFTFTGGNGGSGTGGATATGGNGTGMAFNAGAGGAGLSGTGTNTGGNSGNISFVGLPGGAGTGGTTAVGGTASSIIFKTDVGGVGSGASGSNTNGANGGIIFGVGTSTDPTVVANQINFQHALVTAVSVRSTGTFVLCLSSSTIGLTVQGAASQSVDLQDWVDSASNVLAKIDSAGDLTLNGQTASRALTLNASKKVVTITTTDTELGYVNGVTSAIQTQLNKRPLALFDRFADTASTSTDGTEDDLYSNTIAAGQLTANGDMIRESEYAVFAGSATATRRLKKYFGGTLIWDSGTLTLSAGGDFSLTTEIIRESSTVVRVTVTVASTSASNVPYVTYTRITGLTLSGTNILKTTGIATGVGAAPADITNKMAKIRYEPAA